MIQNKEIRFEVTNKCNAKCIMCPREKMSRPQGVLDMRLYIRVLDEAHSMGADVVSLENYGETFMDPLFFERAAYAKGKGMRVFTITNGSLFDKRCAEKSVYFTDKVRFSIYGTTKEVYESIHKGLTYETVVGNLEYLLELKKKMAAKTPKVEVYFLLMDQNAHQAEEFKKRWLGKADDIAIWKPHNWSDGRAYRQLDIDKKKVTCGRPGKGREKNGFPP
jgi:MoaA/NifB/PqqE/SkfB family radical SAM enzyme